MEHTQIFLLIELEVCVDPCIEYQQIDATELPHCHIYQIPKSLKIYSHLLALILLCDVSFDWHHLGKGKLIVQTIC